MFKLGNWITARDYFNKCNTINGRDRVVEIYLDRCSKFIATPPDEWNGAIVLDFK